MNEADRCDRISLMHAGKLLAVGDDSGNVKLWDVATWKTKQRLAGSTGPVDAVAFSADSFSAPANSAAADSTFFLFSSLTCAAKASSAAFLATAFSPAALAAAACSAAAWSDAVLSVAAASAAVFAAAVLSANMAPPAPNGPAPWRIEKNEDAPYVYACASRKFMLIRLENFPPKIVLSNAIASRSGAFSGTPT